MARLSTTSSAKARRAVVRTAVLLLCTAAAALSSRIAFAQTSATWSANPGSSEYYTGSNWSGGQIPSATGTAIFGSSSVTTLTTSVTGINVGGFTFNSGAPAYTFNLTTLSPGNNSALAFYGAGIVNNSSNAPTINISAAAQPIIMYNSSTLGNALVNTSHGSGVLFENSSLAGTATITNNGGGGTTFTNTSSAQNATIVVNSAGNTQFQDNSTAANATLTVSGNSTNPGSLLFRNNSTAGNATITTNAYGQTTFQDSSSAGNASFIVNSGGLLAFQSLSTANGATIVNNGDVELQILNNLALTVGSIYGSGTIGMGDCGHSTCALTTGGDNSSGTISGVISGAGGELIKAGTGTLTLTGVNTYTGGTTVDAGILRLSGSGTLGSTTFLTANSLTVNGGTLDLNGTSQTVGSLSGAAGGAITLGSGSLTVRETANTTYAGTISGSGSFVVGGGIAGGSSGTLALSGTNTYSGGTTVSGGGLINFNSAGNFGSGSITLNGGGLQWATGTSTDVSARLAPIGSGGGTLDTNGNNVTLASGLSGAGTITKAGAGTLTLAGANTYTGGTTVNTGTLQLAGAGTLGSAAGVTTVNGGILDLGGTTQTQNGGISLTGGTIQNGTLSSSGTFTLQSGTVTANLAGTGLVYVSNTFMQGGTATLSAPNTYSGGTIVSGALQISGAGTLGSTAGSTAVYGTLDLGGTTQTQNGGVMLGDSVPGFGVVSGTIQNGTLSSSGTFNLQSGTVTANLTGSGSAIVSGPSLVILDGTNTYTGGTTVTTGSLEIGDSSNPTASVAGPVAVTANGTLRGVGAIGGSLTNAGYLSPGASPSQFMLSGVRGFLLSGGSSSIGTLSVGGNFAQTSTGSLAIAVSPATASKLAVGGGAALGGTLLLNYNLGTYTPGSVYQVLTAGGGVSGTFGVVANSGQPLGYTGVASYLPNEVDVTLTSTGSGSLGSTMSAQGILLSSASLATDTLFDHLDQVGQGIDGVFTATASSSPVQVAFAGGAEELGAVLAQVPDTFAQYGGWFRATGTFTNVNNQGSIAGYHSSAGAFLAGFDRQITPSLTAGIAGGYGHSSASIHDDGGSSETVDTPRGFVYGRYTFPTMYVDGSLGYAYDTFNLTRPVTNTGTTATSRHDGQEVSFGLQAGRPIALGWATLTPKLGFKVLHLSENGYTESGAGANDLTVAGHDTNSLRPQIGASLDRQFTTGDGTRIVPQARVSYSRELLDVTHEVTEQDASSTSTSVVGLNPARNIVGIGTGVAIATSSTLSLFADYDTDLSPGSATVQTVSAGIRLHF